MKILSSEEHNRLVDSRLYIRLWKDEDGLGRMKYQIGYQQAAMMCSQIQELAAV